MMTHWLSRLAAASAILALAGCATPGLFKLSKDDFPKAGPKNPVIRILGLWEPAEGMAMNKSSRGFSAQILFFSQNSDLAAQVDGEVKIYVFDDQGEPEDQAMAFHEFVYPAPTWNAYMGKGPLGATYAVFIPYTRPGIHEAKCALRIRYTPKGGSPVYSDMVNVVLPGKKKHKDNASGATDDDSAAQEPESEDEAFSEFRRNVSKRQPPHARGMATTIPTSQEVQEQLQAQHRVPAAELSSKERRRIMREATARLDSGEDASHVAHAGYEQPAAEPVAAEESSTGRRLQNPQTNTGDLPDTEGDVESPPAVKPSAKPAMTHILDDDE